MRTALIAAALLSFTAAIGDDVEVYFAHDEPCLRALAKALGEAKRSVIIQAPPIPESLAASVLAAKARGVRVTIDTRHADAGVILIDGRISISGVNAAPIIILRDAKTATKFATNFREHGEHHEPFSARLHIADPGAVRKAAPVSADGAPCKTCDGTKAVKCLACKGTVRAMTLVRCEQTARQGCNGTGTRKCFKCRGAGEYKCAPCKSKGYVRIGSRKTDRGERYTIYRGCANCGGSGSGTMGRFRSYYNSNLVHGRGKATCNKCEEGEITCPRCKGNGEYEKRSRCEVCEKGKVACPTCSV